MNNLINKIYPAAHNKQRMLPMDNYKKSKPNYYDFDNEYIHIKSMFVNEFKKMPNEFFTRNIDTEAVYHYIKGEYGKLIQESYERVYFDWSEQKQVVDHVVLILSNEVIVHIEQSFVEILYSNSSIEFGESLRDKVIEFKAAEKEREFEINIITRESYGLDLKTMAIKPTVLDLNCFTTMISYLYTILFCVGSIKKTIKVLYCYMECLAPAKPLTYAT